VTPRIIRTDVQHRHALREIDRLIAIAPAEHSDAAEQLLLWRRLVNDYETAQLELRCPDPLSAIRYRMQERGLRQKDLVPFLGGRNRASEILAGKRPLTLGMIRKLCESLDIPASLLIRAYKLNDADIARP